MAPRTVNTLPGGFYGSTDPFTSEASDTVVVPLWAREMAVYRGGVVLDDNALASFTLNGITASQVMPAGGQWTIFPGMLRPAMVPSPLAEETCTITGTAGVETQVVFWAGPFGGAW